MKKTTLATNIRELRRHLGLTQEQLAQWIESVQSNVSRWEKEGNQPEPLQLARLAELAGAPVEQFMTEPWEPAPAMTEPDHPPVRNADDDMVELLAVDLSFSMGPGTEIDDYVEETPVKFDLGLLRQITRSPPNRLRLARGIGDSMFPTLLNSDRVMIDTVQRTLNLNDRVWAISLYGAAAIKRLRTVGPDRVLVISDNPAVPDQEVSAEDLHIAGRVVWLARDL